MQHVESPARGSAPADAIWSALVALVSAIYLYARLFRAGVIPVLLGGDQVFFWSYGQRILHGQLPYRDFFQITGPLTDWLFAFAFHALGEHVAAANLVTLVLGIFLTTSVFLLARRFCATSLAALIAAVYLVRIFGKFLSATHHFVSLAAIGIALLILSRQSTPLRCFWAGCACGLATLSTQPHGVVAGGAILLALLVDRNATVPDRARRCAILFAGLLSVVLPVEYILGRAAGFSRLWYDQVVVPSRWPGSSASSAWWMGSDHTVSAAALLIALYAFPPLVYALSAWRLSQAPARHEHRLATMLLLVGTALTAEVWMAANELRIIAVAFPAFALFGYLLRGVRSPRLSFAALAVAFLLIAHSAWHARREPLEVVSVGHERFAARTSEAAKYQYLGAHMLPGESVAELAYPGLYLPTHQLNPLFADNLMPIPTTPAEIVDGATHDLETRGIEWIIWNDALDAVPPPASRDSFDRLRAFLSANYYHVATLANGEHALHKHSVADRR